MSLKTHLSRLSAVHIDAIFTNFFFLQTLSKLRFLRTNQKFIRK